MRSISFKDSSISTKLILVIGFVIIIALGQSLAVGYYLEKFIATADLLIASRQLDGAVSRIVQIDSSFTAIVELVADRKDTTSLPYYQERMTQYQETLATIQDLPVSAEEQSRLSSVLSVREGLFALEKQIISLGSAGKFDDAASLFHGSAYTALKSSLASNAMEEAAAIQAEAAVYQEERSLLYAHTRAVVYGLFLVLLFAGIALAYRVSANVIRTIRDMEEAARAIGRGETGRRVPVHSNDEIGRAAIAFNKMAVALEAKSAEERLREITQEIGE